MEGDGESRDAARRRRNPRPVSVVLASDPVGILNLAADGPELRLGAPAYGWVWVPPGQRTLHGWRRGAAPGLDMAGPAAHARTQRSVST